MIRLTTFIAAVAVALFATDGFTFAGGGYHRGHHGFQFRLGHRYGHLYYGRRDHYSYDAYSYYPSYRTYSYYQSRAYCSPSVIYSQPSVRAYVPDQQIEQQYQRLKVEPPPPPVPSDDLPDPGSRQRSGSGAQFTTLTRGQSEAHQHSNSASDGLGPQLTAAPVRRLVSDDEAPWVVGGSTLETVASSGKMAVAGVSTAEHSSQVANVRE